MKSLKIIDSLHLDIDGVHAKMKNGRLQKVHLQQGDLDGACAVYSTIMILIILGVVKYNEIKFDGYNYDKRFGIERLKKELLDTKGMHRNGNHFYHENEDNLKNMLQRSFSKYIKVEHKDTDVINVIKSQVENDKPVLISFSHSGGGHALVAIGIECDKLDNPTKILCLDPAYPTPKFSYWNSVIDLKENKGKKYKFPNFTESGICQYVKLEDILVIDRK